MAVPVAAGYPQYSGNLITPLYSQDIIERFYCESIFPEISDTNYAGELMRCGDQITFWRSPRAVIHPYSKNQKLEHDILESEPVTLTVDRGHYFNLKLDMVDEKQICNSSELRQYYIKDATFRMTQAVDTEMLAYIPTRVQSENQGMNAGEQSGSYQLGTLASARPVDKNDVTEWMDDIHAVLDEAYLPRDGRFLVLPHIAFNVLMKSELKVACTVGEATASNIALNGRLPNMVHGFNLYRSSNVASSVVGGDRVYSVLAGLKQATAFAAQIEHMRETEHPDYFGKLSQGVMIYGFDVMQSEALALSMATFS